MHVEVHALASGSSGNATLIQADGRSLLIDAGIGVRTLIPALHRRGVAPGNLDAILVTHEHSDHVRSAGAVCQRLKAPVTANRATLEAAGLRSDFACTREMETGSEIALGPFIVRSFPVSHDAVEPVGYLVAAGGTRIAYATDVGCPSAQLREALRSADLCILESNHDVDWLRRGPYPPLRKARVASDMGHLSNHDAVRLIAERLEDAGPACFWLAHLSAVNNSPTFARRYAATTLASLTTVPHQIEVALRDRPSCVWRPNSTCLQLALF